MNNYCNCGGKKIRNYKVLLLVDLRFNSPSIQLIGQPVKTRRGDKVVGCALHVKLNICACRESRAGVMPRKSLPAPPFPPVFSLVMGNVWVSRLKCAEFQMYTQAAPSRTAACSLVSGSPLVSSSSFSKKESCDSWVSRRLAKKLKSRKVSCHIPL